MAGLGARLFPAFSKLTSAQVNGYLMDQSIMRFADATARDDAFNGAGEPTVAEGMTCYLDDTNQLQSYNGSAWVGVAASSTVPYVSSGLVYITGGAMAGAVTTFQGCFTSAYRNYRIVIDQISMSTNYSFYWQALQGATPITASSYVFASTGLNVAGTARSASSTGNNRGYLGIDIAFASSVLGWVSMEVMNPTSTERTVIMHDSIGYSGQFESQRGMNVYNAVGAGAVHDGIRFIADGSTVSVFGNVAIYGYNKV
jgi:hypothetical protein